MKYKFQKGSEVEVWSYRDMALGSWWPAEILSSNGHTYSVRYRHYTLDWEGSVENMTRKLIRPCPPSRKGPIIWVPGDTIEVFEKYSWKSAEVVGVIGRGYYIVRLLGSSMEFRAHISVLRLRLSWQDGKWVMIGKHLEKAIGDTGNRVSVEGNFSHKMLQQFTELKKHSADKHVPSEKDNVFKELSQSLSRVRRRPHIVLRERVVKRTRAVEEESKLLEKVDAVASPQIVMGGKYMHASLNNRRTHITEELLQIVECSDTESISSSVGSCSCHSSPYRLTHPIIGPREDLGIECSDGSPDESETFTLSGSESRPPTKEAVAAEIHRLELHAYRTTLAALHASGPISWEQEALISNLRLMLYISNDEHLLEIKKLLGVKNIGALR